MTALGATMRAAQLRRGWSEFAQVGECAQRAATVVFAVGTEKQPAIIRGLLTVPVRDRLGKQNGGADG